jgi:hypothetical protein
MAVTQAHGNPNWNRDETILALEAYCARREKSQRQESADRRFVTDAARAALSRRSRAKAYVSQSGRRRLQGAESPKP